MSTGKVSRSFDPPPFPIPPPPEVHAEFPRNPFPFSDARFRFRAHRPAGDPLLKDAKNWSFDPNFPPVCVGQLFLFSIWRTEEFMHPPVGS